jgi:hypothetical protein
MPETKAARSGAAISDPHPEPTQSRSGSGIMAISIASSKLEELCRSNQGNTGRLRGRCLLTGAIMIECAPPQHLPFCPFSHLLCNELALTQSRGPSANQSAKTGRRRHLAPFWSASPGIPHHVHPLEHHPEPWQPPTRTIGRHI